MDGGLTHDQTTQGLFAVCYYGVAKMDLPFKSTGTFTYRFL